MDTKKEPVGAGLPAMIAVTVTSKRDSFRRCGIVFGKAPVEITVSPEDAVILKAEPSLIVVEAE